MPLAIALSLPYVVGHYAPSLVWPQRPRNTLVSLEVALTVEGGDILSPECLHSNPFATKQTAQKPLSSTKERGFWGLSDLKSDLLSGKPQQSGGQVQGQSW